MGMMKCNYCEVSKPTYKGMKCGWNFCFSQYRREFYCAKALELMCRERKKLIDENET